MHFVHLNRKLRLTQSYIEMNERSEMKGVTKMQLLQIGEYNLVG